MEIAAFNPDDAYKAKVQAAANTGELPDVLSYWSPDGAGTAADSLAGSGIYVELTDQMTADWKAGFYPNALANSYISQTLMAYTYLGPEQFNARESNGDVTWDDPASVETFRLYDMLSDLWMPGVLATDIDPADLAFAQGKAAFNVGGTYTLSFLLQQGMAAEDLLIFPIPAPAEGNLDVLSLLPLSLIDVGITKDSQNPDAALQWIQYLTSVEGATTFATLANDMPATQISSDPSVVGEQVAAMLGLFQDTGSVFKTY